MRVAAIVPTFNEEGLLDACLRSLAGQKALAEVIVVDGGSAETIERCAAGGLADLGAASVPVLALRAARGRASQLNAGARRARAEVLLFLHADTLLPAGGAELAARAIEAGCAGGAFSHAFLEDDLRLRMVSAYANLRSRWRGLFFGDQGIFVRRDLFERMGGFANIPIMEDVDFSTRLRREGRTILLGPRVLTSGRRFVRGGFWRTAGRMILLRTAWRLGVDPAALARHYAVVR